MSSSGKNWSKAEAVCPRPGHAGSRVRFDGQYGPAGHRLHYYKCTPANGERPHRFTEVLPREESWKDVRAVRARRRLPRGGRTRHACTSSSRAGSPRR